MRNSIALTTVLVVMSLAQPSRAATLEDILAKNLAARGGEANLMEINTLRLTGRLRFGGGNFIEEASWGAILKRGPGGADQGRSELTLQGLTQIHAFYGLVGWKISPFHLRREPEKASAD